MKWVSIAAKATLRTLYTFAVVFLTFTLLAYSLFNEWCLLLVYGVAPFGAALLLRAPLYKRTTLSVAADWLRSLGKVASEVSRPEPQQYEIYAPILLVCVVGVCIHVTGWTTIPWRGEALVTILIFTGLIIWRLHCVRVFLLLIFFIVSAGVLSLAFVLMVLVPLSYLGWNPESLFK